MKSILLTFSIIIASVYLSNAQIEELELGSGYLFTGAADNGGKAIVVQDVRLKKLLNKNIQKNKAEGKMQGWRVQIYLSSKPRIAKDEAEAIKKKFDRKYKLTHSYLKYEAPFFKVQVGDFRTEHEALKFKKELAFEFQNSYIVKEMIVFPDID